MSVSSVRVISDELVGQSISLDGVIELIEAAFAADARGGSMSFPVVRDRLPAPYSGIFGVKAGLAGEVLGLKAGGFFAANRATGDMPHQSTMLLFNPETGRAIALVGANRITGLRTGAAGAVAARHLARPDATRAALIGCGAQGRMQARALARVRPLSQLVVWDRITESAERLAADLRAETGIPVTVAADTEQALRQAEIVVTATPGEGPVIDAAWVRPGMHITAVGADTAGKQELATDILNRATVVVDSRVQSMTIGETQHLRKLGVEPESRIAAELGEVIAGTKPGRTGADEITVFDATGVTFQDLVVADAVYRVCEEKNLGVVVTL